MQACCINLDEGVDKEEGCVAEKNLARCDDTLGTGFGVDGSRCPVHAY